MLNQTLKALFFLLISMMWNFTATAQTPQKGFNYAQKAKIISQAKSGDAEAFFKLGLAHLYGNGADKNDAVAQRFFYYAAKKGHVEANNYIIRITETVEAPALTTRSTAAAKPKDLKKRNITEEKRLKIVEDRKRKRAAARAKARAEAKRAREQKEIEINSVQISENISTPALDPTKDIALDHAEAPQNTKVAATIINELPAASAVRSQTIVSPNISLTATKKQPTLWKYFLLTLGILVLLSFVISRYLRFANMRTALPVGFDKRAYLDFNPDVSAAGVDPEYHFINHGQFENRRYQY